ncbi:MAG TPA: hypothetical protein VFK30_07445 [Anaerolineae bacterium]|nr:hypothetical protein [Anaerolineae bacterium]
MTPSGLWRIDKKEWLGERCFILGGGASVLSQDLNRIKGEKIIAINTSFESLPFPPDFIIFSDSRWWNHNNKKLKDFTGRIVSTSSVVRGPPPLLRMHRKRPPGLADDVGTLAIQFTTLSAAINLAVHLGVNSIVLLGIDGKAIGGKTHHHSPHPWKTIPGCWEKQKKDLALISQQLKERGIECVNASPDSTWEFWPKVGFENVVPGIIEQNCVAA